MNKSYPDGHIKSDDHACASGGDDDDDVGGCAYFHLEDGGIRHVSCDQRQPCSSQLLARDAYISFGYLYCPKSACAPHDCTLLRARNTAASLWLLLWRK